MSEAEKAYTDIQHLVQKIKNMISAERRALNENATRQGYILPLFRALSWDIDNVNEVSPEEKVSRGWVDFSFRLGGVPRFFLETKKASEDLNDPHWVRQALSPDQHFDEIRSLEKRIAQVDAEIDQRVYQLYGLTEEEIRIVEGV